MSIVPIVAHTIDEASFQHDAPIGYENVVLFLASEAIGGADPTTYPSPVIVCIIIKVSEGDNYYNQYCDLDAQGFLGVKIPNVIVKISYYHFVHTLPSVDAQLNWAMNHIKTGKPILWVDSEAGGIDPGTTWADMDRVTGQMLARAEVIGAYSNEEGIRNMPSINASPKPIWFADPSNVDPGQRRSITQNAQGTVPGIEGPVDEDNMSYATAAALPWSAQTTYIAPSTTSTGAAPEVVPTEPTSPTSETSPTASPSEPTAPVEPTPVVPEPAVSAPEQAPVATVNLASQMPVLTKGSPDTAGVKRFQGLLVAAGYDLGTTGEFHDGIDGYFEDITLSKVLLLQHQNGITVDGIAGEETWGVVLGL